MGRLQRLVQETIRSLAAFDADALDRLRCEIEAVTSAEVPSSDLAAAAPANRLLGALLHETERNLKLFRATSSCGVEHATSASPYPPAWI